jgi:hypothetical protein
MAVTVRFRPNRLRNFRSEVFIGAFLFYVPIHTSRSNFGTACNGSTPLAGFPTLFCLNLNHIFRVLFRDLCRWTAPLWSNASILWVRFGPLATAPILFSHTQCNTLRWICDGEYAHRTDHIFDFHILSTQPGLPHSPCHPLRQPDRFIAIFDTQFRFRTACHCSFPESPAIQSLIADSAHTLNAWPHLPYSLFIRIYIPICFVIKLMTSSNLPFSEEAENPSHPIAIYSIDFCLTGFPPALSNSLLWSLLRRTIHLVGLRSIIWFRDETLQCQIRLDWLATYYKRANFVSWASLTI